MAVRKIDPDRQTKSAPVTAAQQAEIDQLRAASAPTRRPTVAALEDILYQPLPVLDHGFVTQ
jgi:thymidylate synthase (FAD)